MAIQQQKRPPKPAPKNTHTEVFWDDIEKFRGRLDLGDYKNLVLSLLFLRARAATHPELWNRIALASDAYYVFSLIDDAIKQTLGLDQRSVPVDLAMLRELIAYIEKIGSHKSHSIPDVFEYCVEKFSQVEGKTGADYGSPQWLVQLLVRLSAPTTGTLFDPCCGSGGLLAHAWQHAKGFGGELSVFGQESNLSTWRICKMNLGARGIHGDLSSSHADSFQRDLHAGLKADFVLANPPFNVDQWKTSETPPQSWPFGEPPENNANFAWIQHIIKHLAPAGTAVFTMGNGALSSNTCGEGDIRREIVEADLIDCIISLPSNLFFSTRIPASIWILSPKSEASSARGRHRQTLFINAQNMGQMIDRIHRELNPDELNTIIDTYRAWRGSGKSAYSNIPGFCRACDLDEIRDRKYILTPGRYVGTELNGPKDEDSPAEKLAYLSKKLDSQFKESIRLEQLIREQLEQVGHGN
jgi:type I restriction enzyme M protein